MRRPMCQSLSSSVCTPVLVPAGAARREVASPERRAAGKGASFKMRRMRTLASEHRSGNRHSDQTGGSGKEHPAGELRSIEWSTSFSHTHLPFALLVDRGL
jgi:hypothetical protein